MFNAYMIDRTTTRPEWTHLYRIMRRVGDRGSIEDESRIAERPALAAALAKCHIDGEICVVETGRDCDCVEYCHSSLRRNLTVIGFERLRDDTYEWADGPCGVFFCRPDERPDHFSRDLALEAHEDGHPHVVSRVRFDEEGAY